MINAINVVAALIRKEGKFLICQRPENKARGLLWEFVGGKVEKGETKQQALKRECREELDIEIEVKDEFMTVLHRYPDITVELTVFEAKITGGNIFLLEHNAFCWIAPDESDNYEFCPADLSILAEIKRRSQKNY